MKKKLAKEAVGWGFGLWAFGYVLGFAFYPFLSPDILGWAIMPFGLAATLWVLLKWLEPKTLGHYLIIGVVWTALAVVLDYFFIVRLLMPQDGYYKPDVYFYYALMLALPILVGLWRSWADSKSS
jgi:hypothetical protein